MLRPFAAPIIKTYLVIWAKLRLIDLPFATNPTCFALNSTLVLGQTYGYLKTTKKKKEERERKRFNLKTIWAEQSPEL